MKTGICTNAYFNMIRSKTVFKMNNNGKGDFHWTPFTGAINWDFIHDALCAIGFTGPVSLETSARSAYPQEIKEYMQIGLIKIAQ